MTHREAPTVAPPPPQVSARAIREQVAEGRRVVSAMAANLNDLERVADRLEGNEHEQAEIDTRGGYGDRL